MESPSDHHTIFGLDGQEIQYAASKTKNFPYSYYTPDYGYSHTPYNPYNPYILGAMIGIDGSYIRSQHYYTVPSYENTVSTPPMVVQSGPDVFANSTHEPYIDAAASSIANRTHVPVFDFPLDYMNAKFFVIKSYSEDDVHKSIKYNVWSSIPNGNKKLYISYDDAQRIAGEEPKGKEDSDNLFDKLDTTKLNAHMKELMPI